MGALEGRLAESGACVVQSKGLDEEASFAGSVVWLSETDPPTQLLTHLRARGIALTRIGETNSIPPSRLAFIAQSGGGGRANLEGRRIALLHPDPGHADRQAQTLREKGGEVIVLALNPALLDNVETFDPDVILVEPTDFYASCWEIVRAIWAHPRLRWSPVLMATPEPLGLGLGSALNTAVICGTIHALSANADSIAQRVRRRATFEIGLHELGPARTLRALTEPSTSVRARFETERCTVEVDIAEGIIVGARGGTSRVIDDAFLGPHALAQLLTEAHGRVQVHPVQSPAVTNVMAPLDTALHSARTSLAPPAARPSSPAVNAPALLQPSVAVDTPRPAAFPLPPLPMATAKRSNVSASKSSNRTVLGMPAAKPSEPKPMAPTLAVSPETSPEDSAPAPGLGFAALATASTPHPQTLPSSASIASADTERIPSEHGRAPALSWPSNPGTTSPFHEDEDVDASSFVHTLPGIARAATSRNVKIALSVVLVCIVTAWSWPSPQDTQVHAATAATEPPSSPKTGAAAPGPALAASPAAHEGSPSDEEESDDEVDDERAESARRASALVGQGHALRKKGQLSAAHARYLEALQQHHGYPRAYAGLTQIALAKRDGAEAVRFGKKLVKARPADARYRLLLGDAYKLSGNLSAAKREWTAAAKKGSKTARERLSRA